MSFESLTQEEIFELAGELPAVKKQEFVRTKRVCAQLEDEGLLYVQPTNTLEQSKHMPRASTIAEAGSDIGARPSADKRHVPP
ncbi:MAG: hypothetical protein QF437_22715, partial [Planctomycetota bacterium]|nr:hypothetical protein [Planctomycetota bacterium]